VTNKHTTEQETPFFKQKKGRKSTVFAQRKGIAL